MDSSWFFVSFWSALFSFFASATQCASPPVSGDSFYQSDETDVMSGGFSFKKRMCGPPWHSRRPQVLQTCRRALQADGVEGQIKSRLGPKRA
jgi:hypothetical protein